MTKHCRKVLFFLSYKGLAPARRSTAPPPLKIADFLGHLPHTKPSGPEGREGAGGGTRLSPQVQRASLAGPTCVAFNSGDSPPFRQVTHSFPRTPPDLTPHCGEPGARGCGLPRAAPGEARGQSGPRPRAGGGGAGRAVSQPPPGDAPSRPPEAASSRRIAASRPTLASSRRSRTVSKPWGPPK